MVEQEQTSAGCPLTSSCMLCYARAPPPHIHINKHTKQCNKSKQTWPHGGAGYFRFKIHELLRLHEVLSCSLNRSRNHRLRTLGNFPGSLSLVFLKKHFFLPASIPFQPVSPSSQCHLPASVPLILGQLIPVCQTSIRLFQ